MLEVIIKPLVLIFIIAFSGSVVAQESKFNIQLRQSHFVTPSDDVEQDQTYTDVFLNYNFHGEMIWGKYEGNLKLIQSTSYLNETYLTSNEAYLRGKESEAAVNWSVGRKRVNWSRLDNMFYASLWQPHFRWDQMHPEAQGLTGLFLGRETQSFRFQFLASPIFLPDQGPNIKEKDGRLYARNRWFANNINSVRLGNYVSPIHFKIEKPEVSDVLFRPTIAANASWNSTGSGPWVSASLGYKPSNDLLIALEPYHDVSLTSRAGITFANVYPKIVNHSLATVELGWNWSRIEVYLSGSEERFDEEDIPVNWISRQVGSRQTMGWGVQVFEPIRSLRITSIGLGQILRREEVLGQGKGGFVSVSDSGLGSYPFNDSLFLEANAKIVDGVKFNTRWIHNFEDVADVFSLGVSYRQADGVSIALGADVIGVENEDSKSFLSQYRGNDSFWGKIGYEF